MSTESTDEQQLSIQSEPTIEPEQPSSSPTTTTNDINTIQQIINYFILHTPTGQLNNVLNDLKLLVPSELHNHIFNDNNLIPLLRQYHTQQLTHITIDDNNKNILVTSYNQISVANSNQIYSNIINDNTDSQQLQQYDEFIDPNTSTIYSVDYIKQAATLNTNNSIQQHSTHESLRSILNQYVQQYIQDTYKQSKALSCVYAVSEQLIICISGKNINLTNYYSGSITCIYKYNTINNTLNGNIHILIHYFEDGNVQLNTTHKLDDISITQTDSDSNISKSIVDKINEFETTYLLSLDNMYNNIRDTTFKSMRRILPVTQTKFNWSSAAHNLAKTINK